MSTVAHVSQDVGSTEVGEQRNRSRGESVQFYHFRREPTYYFRSRFIFVFALLLLSNLYLQAYSIPEIVAKTKPAVVEIVAIDEKGSTIRRGTGFFISPDGQAVTNQHVVKGAASIAAVYNNGAIFLFQRVVAQPVGVDLVILKFQASDVPFLKLGKSSTAVEGQKVIVIGNPTGLTGTVSDGIISAFRERRSLIQITAPISPGSSGSPVMDEDGQVIGVATESVEGQNLNFAIAADKVSAALMQPPSGQFSGPALPTATPPPAIDAKDYWDELESLLTDYDKMIRDSTEAILRNPNDASAYWDRGMAYYYGKKNYDQAISDYTKAIWLGSHNAATYNGRGAAYEKKGNVDEAISDYNEAIRLDANYAEVYNNRGRVYYNRSNFEKAISDFTEAIRRDPKLAVAYENRGKVYLHTGNRVKAKADFATARRLKAAQ